ncbi:MAG: polymorphic toxin type 44 domain-containing protein, partial [bacterium]
QYEDFGNFNFGATAAAMGLTLAQAQMGAGWAQRRAGTSAPEFGSPWGGPPYGDAPEDQRQIELGHRYYRCNCYSGAGLRR